MKKDKIIEYLQNNVDTLRDMVSDANGYDGCLEDYCYYENDEEFFDMFFEGKPMEAVRASYYGEYRYMDAFVQFNGYGNLRSASEWQVEDELKGDAEIIFDDWYELYKDNNVQCYDAELEELIEEMEQKEDGEE